MRRVAVFGNAGGGKSTLSKRLAEITDLPLIFLDLIQYKPGGEKVSDEEYKIAHDEIALSHPKTLEIHNFKGAKHKIMPL